MPKCIQCIEGCIGQNTHFDKTNFTKPFIVDVDWSTKGIGVILSQYVSRNEQVIAYASKGLTPI
jgi:hypothetical protein